MEEGSPGLVINKQHSLIFLVSLLRVFSRIEAENPKLNENYLNIQFMIHYEIPPISLSLYFLSSFHSSNLFEIRYSSIRNYCTEYLGILSHNKVFYIH